MQLFILLLTISVRFSNCIYYNLTCEFEWSKYSCVHQGQIRKALESITYASKNIVYDIGQYVKNGGLQNARLVLVGDSLMRQIFIAIACSTAESIDKKKVNWMEEWPCHGTMNCINTGLHGGFNIASVTYKEGGEIHFLPLGGSPEGHTEMEESNITARLIRELEVGKRISVGRNMLIKPNDNDQFLNSKDVLLMNLGIHGDYRWYCKL